LDQAGGEPSDLMHPDPKTKVGAYGPGHCIRYRAAQRHRVTGPESTAGAQSVYNKLILALTLTLPCDPVPVVYLLQ